MLRRFAVENFRNFKNRTEVDFTAVHNYTFSPHCVKNGILNKAILLGKNGSGKTNLGLALFDIVMTLTDSAINLRQTDPGAYLNGDSTSKEAAFEYEFQQALANKKLYDGAETVFLTTKPENMFISSSVVKQIAQLGGDITDFVPGKVKDIIVERFSKRPL